MPCFSFAPSHPIARTKRRPLRALSVAQPISSHQGRTVHVHARNMPSYACTSHRHFQQRSSQTPKDVPRATTLQHFTSRLESSRMILGPDSQSGALTTETTPSVSEAAWDRGREENTENHCAEAAESIPLQGNSSSQPAPSASARAQLSLHIGNSHLCLVNAAPCSHTRRLLLTALSFKALPQVPSSPLPLLNFCCLHPSSAQLARTSFSLCSCTWCCRSYATKRVFKFKVGQQSVECHDIGDDEFLDAHHQLHRSVLH